MKPIRALVLAAGLGTRLRPITLKPPKCLVPINGKPIMEYWLDKIFELGCESTLINTHYLSNQVEEYISSTYYDNMSLITTYEKELLGTAGTILKNRKFFNNCTGIVIHCDNITDIKLNPLLEAHKRRSNGTLITMLTFNSNSPTNCGIVEIDEKGILKNFYEKVDNPPSNKANGAVYIFDEQFLEEINNTNPPLSDFSLDVIPRFLNRIQTFHIDQDYIDIGTPTELDRAKLLWEDFQD